ncbi:TolC family protein [Desulfallas sp. Bu1-1]|uniref:TolC family protein n=1 Tax=Desulfallas sp. Bu1-1 TaxID=2787620 RepID=UPI00189C69E7|nr:TolC family protein [Desulfallas sp. Bu1-1]MBF7082917.1 TolC family protein [Desulfallas sp. Bu1-1]
MKGKVIFLLAVLIVLSGFSNVYAAEDVAEDVITLEQAVKLAEENSRSLTKYEISKRKAKYQLYEINDQYWEANYDQDVNMNKYNSLSQEYSDLQAKEDLSEDDINRMNEIKEEMDAIWDDINKQSDAIESLSDQKRDAEDNYDDSVAAEENYQKQLEYTVEELYTTILIQEESLLTSSKEYELKLNLLNIEKVKLQLGRSSRLNVNQLSRDVTELNKKIIELNSLIKNLKGELNDMMGREYGAELRLVPFEIQENIEIPEYDTLFSKAAREYDAIAVIKRDISNKKDDLDSIDDDGYQEELLELEIKEKELELEDERYKLKEAINNLIAEVKSKQEDYQLSLIDYKNAQKKYDWDQKRFEQGRISKLALMQSELDYLNAKNKNTSAGYGLYLAYRSLQLAEAGIL